MDEILVGPAAALALAILVLGLFYTGKILPRNAVPREDFEKLREVNADLVEGLGTLTKSIDALMATVRHVQQNGGV